MPDIDTLVERLRRPMLADAFEKGRITSGLLCELLIRERAEAADALVALKGERDGLLKFHRAVDNASFAHMTDAIGSHSYLLAVDAALAELSTNGGK